MLPKGIFLFGHIRRRGQDTGQEIPNQTTTRIEVVVPPQEKPPIRDFCLWVGALESMPLGDDRSFDQEAGTTPAIQSGPTQQQG